MEKEKKSEEEAHKERIVRILSKDIEGGMNVYAGLSRINGISWTLANAICKTLKIDKKSKIGSLTGEEINKITDFTKTPSIPAYLLNRRKDFETGEDKHLTGSGLELQKQFDIKRLKKIKSYKGYRHSAGLPVRGQRTRSNFRKSRRKGAGIKKKPKKQ